MKRGEYRIPGSSVIKASGIVLRGEGNTEDGTRLIATAPNQKPLIDIQGSGKPTEVPGTRVAIADKYVPTGTTSIHLGDASKFAAGDKVILYTAPNNKWVSDLKMDQIIERGGTRQWKPEEYNLSFERTILRVKGNTVELDNPVMMPIDADVWRRLPLQI